MIPYRKKISLSSRSKRRRIAEEVEYSKTSLPQLENNTIFPTSNINLLVENPITEFDPNRYNNVAMTSTDNTQAEKSIENVIVSNNRVSDSVQILNNLLDPESSPTIEESFLSFNETSQCDEIFNTRLNLRKWAVDYNIPQHALNGLLSMLKQHKCFKSLPKDSRTLMQNITKNTSNFYTINPGLYYHFGVENGIKLNIYRCLESDIIELVIGIDGLPLFKSSSDQFWPILAYIHSNGSVFPIGIYYGKEKPSDSNHFLSYFIDELKLLVQNGIEIDNKVYGVSVRVFCCDAPAKSYILKIKGHSGFYSCSRCEQEGKYLLKRVCFPYLKPESRPCKRTHSNYLTKSGEDHHVGDLSIVASVPNFDVVNDFSLDYLHLVCLGTVRKLIHLWIKGPVRVRYPSWKINKISVLLNEIKINCPSEIARKPRGLDQVNRWKGTEFRTFLLYVGTVVSKSVLSKVHWNHFFHLNISMIILLSPEYAQYLDLARQLLDSFVEHFERIYGRHLISHNIHGLLHLCDDYAKFGPLDQCSTFPFENYMGVLKNMIRKPHKPLEQIVNRYNEKTSVPKPIDINQDKFHLSGPHCNGPKLESTTRYSQFKVLKSKNAIIKSHIEADSYLLTSNKKVVKVFNIIQTEHSDILLICKQFKHYKLLFNKPIKSSLLDIYVVNELSEDLIVLNINYIKKKVFLIPSNNYLIALPIAL